MKSKKLIVFLMFVLPFFLGWATVKVVDSVDNYKEGDRIAKLEESKVYQFSTKVLAPGKYRLRLAFVPSVYYGGHDINSPEGRDSNSKWYEDIDKYTDLRLSFFVQVFVDNKLKYETTTDEVLPEATLGAILYDFISPRNVPLNKKITFKIKVLHVDERFHERYGWGDFNVTPDAHNSLIEIFPIKFLKYFVYY